MPTQCGEEAKGSRPAAKGAAGKVGSVPDQRTAPGRNDGLSSPVRPRCDIRHTRKNNMQKVGRWRSTQRAAIKRNGGRHRCQPPLSGPIPAYSASLHPGPLFLRSAARKTMRCSAPRNNPATVWSAPFRGPAAPGKPFIISSCVCRSSRCPSDGLHFLYLIGSASTRGNRYVP